MKHKLNRLYWEIYSIFFPQHKSLRKAIPRTWMDLDDIVDTFLDAVIISFVEEEKGLDQIEMIESYERANLETIDRDWGSVHNYTEYRKNRLPDLKKLSEIYTWVKTGRKIEQKILDEAYESGDYVRAEREQHAFYEKNTRYYTELVRLRGYLWT